MQLEENHTNQQILKKYSQQNLQLNKKQMLKILKEAPIAGIYLNEDQTKWPQFFNFYMNFLKSEIGPRGQCTKKVRIQLAKNPEFYDEILKLINMTHQSHIRDIYVKYKIYSPCAEYDQILKLKQNLQKNQQSYSSIMDENSIMYNQIKQGMLDKRGPDYDYKAQIQVIRMKYKQKLENLKKTKVQLQQKLDKTQTYIKYIKLRGQMQKYFVMWRQADVKIGYESIQKGDSFQKIVQTYLLPILLKRSGIDLNSKYKVQSNCRWYPKTLGQIDIAIITFNQNDQKWEVAVLIQCKSRLFDIREAYKQVAVLKQKGKQKLATKIGILNLVDNPINFIVTTLPENPFHLAIQSKLKQALQRAGKNQSIDQLKSQQVYIKVKQVLKDQLSPLDWFLQNDSQRLIVLKY